MNTINPNDAEFIKDLQKLEDNLVRDTALETINVCTQEADTYIAILLSKTRNIANITDPSEIIIPFLHINAAFNTYATAINELIRFLKKSEKTTGIFAFLSGIIFTVLVAVMVV